MGICRKVAGGIFALAASVAVVAPVHADGYWYSWPDIEYFDCQMLRGIANSYQFGTYSNAFKHSYREYTQNYEYLERQFNERKINDVSRIALHYYRNADLKVESEKVARRYVECGAVRDDSKQFEKENSKSSGSSFASLSS